MLWSELSPGRLEVELGKAGTTVHDLETDIRDVPEVKPWVEGLSPEAKRQLAIEYFGDQGHPQPPQGQRTKWHITGYTREFGRLPRLDGEDAAAATKRGARELGIPERELFWILERRLENGQRASRKWLALETKTRSELEYVPRDRLSPFVDWIDAHPDRAGRMRSLRRIPSEFRAGKLGPIPPSS